MIAFQLIRQQKKQSIKIQKLQEEHVISVLNPGAVRRYYLTSEYTEVLALGEMVQVNKFDLQHTDMHSPQIIKDEKTFSKAIDVIGCW